MKLKMSLFPMLTCCMAAAQTSSFNENNSQSVSTDGASLAMMSDAGSFSLIGTTFMQNHHAHNCEKNGLSRGRLWY